MQFFGWLTTTTTDFQVRQGVAAAVGKWLCCENCCPARIHFLTFYITINYLKVNLNFPEKRPGPAAPSSYKALFQVIKHKTKGF
jgi:hypothetical protein